jgi:hypothetical protein
VGEDPGAREDGNPNASGLGRELNGSDFTGEGGDRLGALVGSDSGTKPAGPPVEETSSDAPPLITCARKVSLSGSNLGLDPSLMR